MGNAFAHIPYTYRHVVDRLGSVLDKKNSVIVAQLSNYEKFVKTNNRLRRFVIKRSKQSPSWEHAYFWFYDLPVEEDDLLTLNVGILDFDGRTWVSRGLNSVDTVPFTTESLSGLFKDYGFPEASFYGPKEGEPILNYKFKPFDT